MGAILYILATMLSQRTESAWAGAVDYVNQTI